MSRKRLSLENRPAAQPAAQTMPRLVTVFAVLALLLHVVSASPPANYKTYYLYSSDDSVPVIDYHPSGNVPDEPDFLYGTDQGPRVVEFYAHWCHHVSFQLPDWHT
jgi:hypothetical protein